MIFHIETSLINNTPRRAASQRGFAHWRAIVCRYCAGTMLAGSNAVSEQMVDTAENRSGRACVQ